MIKSKALGKTYKTTFGYTTQIQNLQNKLEAKLNDVEIQINEENDPTKGTQLQSQRKEILKRLQEVKVEPLTIQEDPE